MAIKVAIKGVVTEIMSQSPDGMSLAAITEGLKKRGQKRTQENVRKRLSELVDDNLLVKDGSLYHLASVYGGGPAVAAAVPAAVAAAVPAAVVPAEKATSMSPAAAVPAAVPRRDNLGPQTTVEEERTLPPRELPPAPGDYDKFRELGLAVGIRDELLLDAICNHVFTGNSHDLNWVFEALTSMHLPRDYFPRWFRLWQSQLNLPIPPELAERLAQTPAGAGASQPGPTRWAVMGGQIFRDPHGEFDSPAAALGFAEAQRKIEGALGQQSGGAEIVRAMSEIQSHAPTQAPQQTINWAEVFTAIKPQFGITEMLQLMQMMQPPPPPPQANFLSQLMSLLQVSPDFIGTFLGLLKRGLGLEEIQTKLASISQPPVQPMISLGDGSLSLPDYKEVVRFGRDIARSDNAERRTEEAHKNKLTLYGDLREKIPEFFTAAQRAVERLEQPQQPKGKRRPPTDETAPEQEVMLQSTCPECGGPLTAPKSNPVVECPQCSSTIKLEPKEAAQ